MNRFATTAPLLLIATACGGGNAATPPTPPTAVVSSASAAPAPTTAPAPAPAKVTGPAPKLPSLAKDTDLDAWMKGPCLGYDPAKKQFACVHGELEAGFFKAIFTVLDDAGKVVSQVALYEGRSEIEKKGHKADGVAKAEKMLASGFVAGAAAFDAKGVERKADATFALNADGKTLSAAIPKFAKGDAPQGYAGDPNNCMRWDAAGGQRWGAVAALRVSSAHTFTTDKGKPCHHPEPLSDESFPAQERWLVMKAR